MKNFVFNSLSLLNKKLLAILPFAHQRQQQRIVARPPEYPLIPVESAMNQPFMTYSTCSAKDFLHPKFQELSRLINSPPLFHRKYWEWIYILNVAFNKEICKAGKRALGFGVGQEPIPAALAKFGVYVTATDAPITIGEDWNAGGQYAGDVNQLNFEGIVDQARFNQHVTHRIVDMNAIDSDLCNFDFCWSSCALEHLGSLQHGIDFIINSVEKTLKPGGIACHTTEYNVDSNEHTVTTGSTVIYRRCDIEKLIIELRQRGHIVDTFCIAPDTHELDRYVDIPPFSPHGHIKLLLEGYTSTSVALVIQRSLH